DAEAICGKYLARGFNSAMASGGWTCTLPASVTSYPRSEIELFKPAIRIADGPISTPRRPAPRSIGTPMIFTRLLMAPPRFEFSHRLRGGCKAVLREGKLSSEF